MPRSVNTYSHRDKFGDMARVAYSRDDDGGHHLILGVVATSDASIIEGRKIVTGVVFDDTDGDLDEVDDLVLVLSTWAETRRAAQRAKGN